MRKIEIHRQQLHLLLLVQTPLLSAFAAMSHRFDCFRPHLPDQVYDVQAEVKPIGNPKVIWSFIV